jgi:hypothetical protein
MITCYHIFFLKTSHTGFFEAIFAPPQEKKSCIAIISSVQVLLEPLHVTQDLLSSLVHSLIVFKQRRHEPVRQKAL